MTELEGETPGHARGRLLRRARQSMIELALGGVFLAFVFFADRAGSGAASAAAVAAAVGVLAVWLLVYIWWHRSFDEFERGLELKAIALAAGIIIVAASGWGLAELVLDAPTAPIVFIAPAFSVVYATIRMLIGRAYR